MAKRNIKLNKKDVNAAILKFVGGFLVLLLFSMMCLFFLYESNDRQQDFLRAKVEEANNIYRIDIEMQTRLEEIFEKLEFIRTSGNNRTFITQIRNEIVESRELIQGDNEGHFLHYHALLNDMELIIDQRRRLVETQNKMEQVKRQFENCLKKRYVPKR